MTDKQTLFEYRKKQSEDTINDAKIMLDQNLSPRSIINRAFYAIFYCILSLFIKADVTVKTSKHTGIIGLFDKEFINTEKIEKEYSKILHTLFDDRQELDYKELIEVNKQDAVEAVNKAKEFIKYINNYIKDKL